MKEKRIQRRGFLKLSGLAAGGLAFFGGFKLLEDDILKQTVSPSKELSQSAARGDIIVQPQETNVSVCASHQGHDMEAAVIEAAQAATDFSWLKNGQVVFIKTVNNSGFSYPATSSPIAVSAMIKLLKEKGAGRVIVGDMLIHRPWGW